MRATLFFTLLLSVGYLFGQRTLDLQTARIGSNTPSLSLGVGFSPYLLNGFERGAGLRGLFGSINAQVSDRWTIGFSPFLVSANNQPELTSELLLGANVYGRYYFYTSHRLRLFAETSLGLSTFKIDRDHVEPGTSIYRDWSMVAGLGVGAEYRLTRRLSLEAKVSYLSNYNFGLNHVKGPVPFLGLKYQVN